MVLLGRIELPTSALPRMRSTTELQQHTIPCARTGQAVRAGARYWLRALALSSARRDITTRMPMREETAPLSREERLAAKLRENLRRRKEQAREIGRNGTPTLPKDAPGS